MLRAWFAAHRSAAATAVSGAVVTALIATVAVVSGGYDAQRFDLGDGSVWVANGSKQVIGRANTQVLSLDTVVGTDGTELTVLQSDAGLLIFDLTDNKVDMVDPATAAVTATAPLPPRTTDVQLAGANLVIHSAASGGVWIAPIIDLAVFDSASEPSFSLGADSLISVTPAGRLFLYSPSAGEIYEVDAATDDAVVTTTSVSLGEPGDSMALTAVGDRPVLFDLDFGHAAGRRENGGSGRRARPGCCRAPEGIGDGRGGAPRKSDRVVVGVVGQRRDACPHAAGQRQSGSPDRGR